MTWRRRPKSPATVTRSRDRFHERSKSEITGESSMASIRKEILTTASPADAWAAIRDVGALHHRLVPGFVVDTRLEPGARIVTFANGMIVNELIVDLDDDARRLAWSAVGGRLTHHNASVQVFPLGEIVGWAKAAEALRVGTVRAPPLPTRSVGRFGGNRVGKIATNARASDHVRAGDFAHPTSHRPAPRAIGCPPCYCRDLGPDSAHPGARGGADPGSTRRVNR